MKFIDLYRVTLTGLFICTLNARGEQGNSNDVEKMVKSLLSQMTIAEKVNYLAGAPPADPTLPNSTGQDIPPVPRLGLPELRNCDGPVGIRVSTPATRYPANLLLAASWDPERAFDQAKGIARDARARGFAVWYGPGVDMYRVPVGGRNSEYMCGEDPFLGSRMAVAQIRGAQGQGVVATVKHFVANDQDYRRFTINNVVDERTLREINFPPFEAAIRKGDVGSCMMAYSALNGVFCSEDPFLMQTMLASEWGFKGFKVSDYGAVHDPVNAIQQGQDIIYGGFAPQSTAPLLQAVNSGQLSLARLDDAVSRILRIIVKFHFLERPQLDPSIPLDDPFGRQAGLNSARQGITLLKSDGLLPFRRGQTRSIAVVGRYAGGDPPSETGSGTVIPIHFTSEINGLQQIANGATNVVYLREGNLDFNVAEFRSLSANGQYQPGLKAEYYNNEDLSGSPVLTRQEDHLSAIYPTQAPPQVGTNFSVRWSGEFVAPVKGDYAVKFQMSSNARVYLSGEKIFDNWQTVDGTSFSDLKFCPTILVPKVPLQAGQSVAVRFEYKFPGTLFYHIRGVVPQVGLGWATLEPPANLNTYNAVVITAGFDQSYEGEQADRAAVMITKPGLYEMPELQDDLIANMAAKNSNTVVVLHGGGSMGTQKWINQVHGLVHVFFPGQDGGQALAEILFGDVNPSGKLPFTFEKRFQNNPAYPNYPNDLSVDATGNTAVYREGIFMGYRGFDKNGPEPLYPFGYGLSYTTFAYSDLDIEPAQNDRDADGDREKHGLGKTDFKEHGDKDQDLAKVSFTVTNTGRRAGAEIAELYVGEKNPPVLRPIKELKGFKKVFLQPGNSRRVTLELDQRSFAFFDTGRHLWVAKSDIYNILVGNSSQNLPLKGQFKLKSELTSKP
jgi:beta-glucosidase